jgi:hypothetical protein
MLLTSIYLVTSRGCASDSHASSANTVWRRGEKDQQTSHLPKHYIIMLRGAPQSYPT